MKTITNSCFQALEGLKFQALEGLKFQALEGLKFQDKQTQKQMIQTIALPFLQVFYFTTFNSYGFGEFCDKLNFSSFTTLVFRVVCLSL
jgi:hypothetical protein